MTQAASDISLAFGHPEERAEASASADPRDRISCAIISSPPISARFSKSAGMNNDFASMSSSRSEPRLRRWKMMSTAFCPMMSSPKQSPMSWPKSG